MSDDLAKALKLAPGTRLLFVGCANGAVAAALATAACVEVVGVVSSEENAAAATKAVAAAEGGGGNVTFSALDVDAAPASTYAPASFGAVYVVGAGATEALLAKLRAWLVPGGRLVCYDKDGALAAAQAAGFASAGPDAARVVDCAGAKLVVATNPPVRGTRLAGKVCVVTGASSGIGEAIALALAREGARVAVGARRKPLLDALVARINAEAAAATGTDGSAGGADAPVAALGVKTDVTDRASVKALVAAAEAGLGGPVDILVNNAGVMYFTNMKNAHEDEWARTVDVNCKGVLHGIGAVLPGMVERGSGHIVNTSSDAGRRIFGSLAVYCASKYFVEALSEGTRRELVGTGVKVTTIQPGDVAGTNLVTNNTDKEALAAMGVDNTKAVGHGWGNRNCLLRPEDVADAVVYAVTAPAHVAVNEVLVEPRDQA